MKTKDPGSAPKPFQCPSCPKSYLHGTTLKEHILIKHGDGESKFYFCEKCPHNNVLGTRHLFATKRRLDKHIRRVHRPPRFKCHVCFKAFRAQSELGQHQRVHNPNISRQGPKCELCSKTYHSKHALHRHLFTVHKKKTAGVNYFICELCALEFVNRVSLERHVVNTHVVDKSFECAVCSKTFLDQETLDNHVKTHDTQIKHFCDECSKGFRVKESLVHHLGLEHKKNFYCYKCCKSFSNKFEFDQHSDPKTSAELKLEFKCQICAECFDFQCNLDIHKNCHVNTIFGNKMEDKTNVCTETKDPQENKEPEELTGKCNIEFKCELCLKSFDREPYFKAHRKQVHPKAEWTCSLEQCSKTFKKYHRFRDHKMTHSDTKQFLCVICQKSFHTSTQLKAHEREHAKTKGAFNRLQCPSCPKFFYLEQTRSDHVRSKHSEGKLTSFYSCDKCLQKNPGATTTYVTQRALKIHVKRVHGDKPVALAPPCVCQVCFKTFKSLTNLRNHRRVHIPNNSEKTHKCFLCSRAFYTNQCFWRHLFDVHKKKIEGVNYFKCDFCDLEFLSRYYLECHVVRKHVVDKEFQCAVCSKAFIDQASLDRHIKSHDKQIRHVCDICSEGFNVLPHLTRHLRVKHKKFFYCNKCSRSFSNKSEFDQHSNPKTSGSELKLLLEFKCQICGLNLDSQCLLDTHTNGHLNEINFQKADSEDKKNVIPFKLE